MQIKQGKLQRGKPFNGYATVSFTNPFYKGNVQGKYKKGFTLGRCFVLRDNKIAEIRGNFVNDELKVSLAKMLKLLYGLPTFFKVYYR